MRPLHSHADPESTGEVPPLASVNVLLAAYGDMLGAAFGIMHELTMETMALTHRAAEFWLTQGAHYRAGLGIMVPWTPLMVPERQAAGADAEASHANSGSVHEDDDACCGDACTSKACKRMLKSLELAVSDFH